MADINTSSLAQTTATDVKGLLNVGCIVLQPWKIESSCKNLDGSFSYLVRWRDVWLHEVICAKFSNLVNEYWIENGGGGNEEEQHTQATATPAATVQLDVSSDIESKEQDQTSVFETVVEDLETVAESSVEEGKVQQVLPQEITFSGESIEQQHQQADILDMKLEESAITNKSNPLAVEETAKAFQNALPQLVKNIVRDTLELTSSNLDVDKELPTKESLEKQQNISRDIEMLKTTDLDIDIQTQLVKNIVRDSLEITSSNLIVKYEKETKKSLPTDKKPTTSSYRKTGPQKCEVCDKTLSSRNSLREHRIAVHLKNGRFTCSSPSCDKRFASRRALRIHNVSHTVEREYVCEKCDSTHKRPRDLKLHMLDMHTEGTTRRCDVCFKCFREKAQLKEHCFTVHKDAVTDCIVCKQRLTTPFSIYTHCLKHGGVREYICDVCERDFLTQKALTDHKITHDPDRKPFRVCPKCGKALFSRSHYYEHVNSHDAKSNDIIKFNCNLCDVSFQHTSSLKRHTLRHRPGGDLEHPKENPYLTMDESLLPSLCCRICRRNYTSKSGFYDHRRRCRDGIVTVADCEWCDKKYTKRSALNRHIRSRHPEMLTQFFEVSEEGIEVELEPMAVEIEPTTVEVLDVGGGDVVVGESGAGSAGVEIDDQAGLQVQFQVALAPVKVEENANEQNETNDAVQTIQT